MLYRYYLIEQLPASAQLSHDVEITLILIELENLDDVRVVLKKRIFSDFYEKRKNQFL